MIDENVEFFKGDIDNLDDLYKASQDCSAVIHAAALSTVWGLWEDFYNVNVIGTKNIVQVCEEKKIKISFLFHLQVYMQGQRIN